MKNALLRKKLSFLLPITILLILSLLNMYGAKFISDLYASNFLKQVLWIAIGILVMLGFMKIDFKFILRYSGSFYVLGLIMLVLVLFFGKNVNGATSWFKIGPFSFQPSELFKAFFIVHLAKVISKEKGHSLKLLVKILFLSFLPALLIFLEPDTGVVIMYLLMMFGLLMESPVEKKYIFLLVATGSIFLGTFISLYFFKSDIFIKIFGTSFFYRMDRLLSFKNASSYQLSNALVGVGASGLTGLGLTSSKIYIPEVTTDFVFDLTICNFGYLMGIFVVVLYVFILYRIYRELMHAKKSVDRCILSSIFYMMLFQICEHILMNIGLTPITGITLPFLSYGGSSLLSYFMLFGLILKITTNNSSYS